MSLHLQPGRGPRRLLGLALGAALLAAAAPAVAAADAPQAANSYRQTNLISDIPGVARITDPHLVNPWGIVASPTSPLWVANNNSNTSTLYTGGVDGSIPSIVPLVVSIPFGAPTGVVFNPTSGFLVHVNHQSAPANFIFDSEAGRITAWSNAVSGTKATIAFADPNAVYKGLAMASIGTKSFLYATNFRAGTVDMFNESFHKVTMPGAFVDPSLPPRFAPFGIQLINGMLYVSYARQDAAKENDVAGPGLGFVDVYSTTGVLEMRLISRGALNAPWGMVLAPASFGPFAGDLLVGNFGDGTIHAYDPVSGAPLGELQNPDGNPIDISGLWSLRFGNGVFAAPDELVFTAGLAAETHGLLGEIAPAG